VKWIFLETLPVSAQADLDRYVQSPRRTAHRLLHHPGVQARAEAPLALLYPGGTADPRRTCEADSADACIAKLAAPAAVRPAQRELR
jgi:hypothetical protein